MRTDKSKTMGSSPLGARPPGAPDAGKSRPAPANRPAPSRAAAKATPGLADRTIANKDKKKKELARRYSKISKGSM